MGTTSRGPQQGDGDSMGGAGGGAAEAVAARYSRQVLVEGIGEAGQRAISRTRVVLAGCGALGSLQASFLVRAGFGTVRIVDRDLVEETNLTRQLLFDEEDVRTLQPKAVAAARRLRVANSQVTVEGLVDDINPGSVERLLGGFDVILDATDNFETRLLLNDYAVKTGTPWVYGGCVSLQGLSFPVVPGETACFRCVFESAPPPGMTPTCDTVGVLAPVVGVIASLQVAEVVKLAVGRRDRVTRSVAIVDLWRNQLGSAELPAPLPDCPCCGEYRFEYLDGDLGTATTSLCGRNAVQVRRGDGRGLDLGEVAARLGPLGRVERNRFLVRAAIDDYELTIFADGRAIVGGTDDAGVAKSVYARYIGT